MRSGGSDIVAFFEARSHVQIMKSQGAMGQSTAKNQCFRALQRAFRSERQEKPKNKKSSAHHNWRVMEKLRINFKILQKWMVGEEEEKQEKGKGKCHQ